MMAAMFYVFYALLFLWSAWCVFSHRVNDGVFGRVFYSAIAIAAFAAIFSDHTATVYRSNQILVASIACIGVRHFIMKMYKAHRKPRI